MVIYDRQGCYCHEIYGMDSTGWAKEIHGGFWSRRLEDELGRKRVEKRCHLRKRGHKRLGFNTEVHYHIIRLKNDWLIEVRLSLPLVCGPPTYPHTHLSPSPSPSPVSVCVWVCVYVCACACVLLRWQFASAIDRWINSKRTLQSMSLLLGQCIPPTMFWELAHL